MRVCVCVQGTGSLSACVQGVGSLCMRGFVCVQGVGSLCACVEGVGSLCACVEGVGSLCMRVCACVQGVGRLWKRGGHVCRALVVCAHGWRALVVCVHTWRALVVCTCMCVYVCRALVVCACVCTQMCVCACVRGLYDLCVLCLSVDAAVWLRGAGSDDDTDVARAQAVVQRPGHLGLGHNRAFHRASVLSNLENCNTLNRGQNVSVNDPTYHD
jgi:hypothetical protein